MQRQIYDVQRELRAGNTELKQQIEVIDAKLTKALEHSAAHKARLDGQDKSIEQVHDCLEKEKEARENQGMQTIGAVLAAVIALFVAVGSWLFEHLNK